MSNYLSDLAARAVGMAQVILPRRASRFEPPSFGELPISRVWDENNGQDSGSHIFDDQRSVEERITSQPLAQPLGPLRTIDAPKRIIGDNKVESIPVQPIKKEPEGQPQFSETALAEPPSHIPSKAIIKESRKADLFAEKPSGVPNTEKTVPNLERSAPVENAAKMALSEQPNFREIKGHEGIGQSITLKREIQPLLTPVLKQVTTEKNVSETLLAAPRNEKIPASLSIEKDAKILAIEPPDKIIENKRISEAGEKIRIIYSEPASHKITQPFTGAIPVQTSSIRDLRQTDANITQSKLVRKPDNNIHVTIGSIEVRATLPPVRAKNEGKTPPVMSLDEYLHKRGGSR